MDWLDVDDLRPFVHDQRSRIVQAHPNGRQQRAGRDTMLSRRGCAKNRLGMGRQRRNNGRQRLLRPQTPVTFVAGVAEGEEATAIFALIATAEAQQVADKAALERERRRCKRAEAKLRYEESMRAAAVLAATEARRVHKQEAAAADAKWQAQVFASEAVAWLRHANAQRQYDDEMMTCK